MGNDNGNHYYLVFRYIAGVPPSHTLCIDIKEYESEAKLEAGKDAQTNLPNPPGAFRAYVTTEDRYAFIANCASHLARNVMERFAIQFLGMDDK